MFPKPRQYIYIYVYIYMYIYERVDWRYGHNDKQIKMSMHVTMAVLTAVTRG